MRRGCIESDGGGVYIWPTLKMADGRDSTCLEPLRREMNYELRLLNSNMSCVVYT